MSVKNNTLVKLLIVINYDKNMQTCKYGSIRHYKYT